jgi:pimeloyl-ACP methyl ester carboxylesterase
MTRVVYLHGFASGPSSSKARRIRARLEAAGAHIDIPDLAAGDFENLTITAQLAVLDRVAAGSPINLIGSSMGGYLAALYAARHPEVHRLVLLAPAFGFNRRWPERLGPAQMERWKREDSLPVFHYGDARMRSLRYALIADAAKYEDFPDFSQPALIFHGIHDDIVPVTLSEQFSAGHTNAHLEIVDSGHDLLNVLKEIGERTVEFLE